jgi:hypothetical protein
MVVSAVALFLHLASAALLAALIREVRRASRRFDAALRASLAAAGDRQIEQRIHLLKAATAVFQASLRESRESEGAPREAEIDRPTIPIPRPPRFTPLPTPLPPEDEEIAADSRPSGCHPAFRP